MQNHKKRLGQHFLHDNNIIKKIIMSIRPKKNDHFLEIGPGEGALTKPIIDITKNVTLIEKDKDLIPLLRNQYHQYNKVKILHADILKCNLLDYMKNDIRLIGNLPYNISTEIIFRVASVSSKVKDMHFMLQKEVVDRMVAKPGSKTYGRLSIMTQVYFDTIKLFDISPNVFVPKPKVQSSYIRMVPRTSAFKNTIYETGYYIGGLSQNILDISSKKQIILATYQMAAEGMNIPTLNTVIFASPISDIQQAIGRILREKPNERKYIPLCIDIWDQFSLFINKGFTRIKYYKKNNYNIKYFMDNELISNNDDVNINNTIIEFINDD